jgi:acyl-CoA dehydrogenase
VTHPVDAYQDIREDVRDLCSNFFRKIAEERACPEAFVHALTDAGRAPAGAAAFIPGRLS